jgi:FMN reductase
MSFLVISSSLNPASKSLALAKEAHRHLSEKHSADWLDLHELELPHCDGANAYGHPNVKVVSEKIAKASCILLAVPIYNFASGSAAKNLIELTGKAWSDKTVGFLCAAGGKSSYMSIMNLANSLMLDFRSLIIPRFVYADGSAFGGGEIVDAEIATRISELVEAAIKLDGAALPERQPTRC